MNRNYLELESVQEKDQKAIKDFREGKISDTELSDIMSKNLKYVMGVIKASGFPFKNKTSERAYMSAFLSILHSGDVEIMERIIDIFSRATTLEINKRDLAYIIDKRLVLKGLPQIYGTQYKIKKDETIEFFPIQDEALVDVKRAEMGMDTISEYKKFAENNI